MRFHSAASMAGGAAGAPGGFTASRVPPHPNRNNERLPTIVAPERIGWNSSTAQRQRRAPSFIMGFPESAGLPACEKAMRAVPGAPCYGRSPRAGFNKGAFMSAKRIGILTGGGDVPGLNSVIKTVVYRASECGSEVFVIRRGWEGRTHIDLKYTANRWRF